MNNLTIKNIIKNFWNKVNYPGNDVECWEWTAAKGSNKRVYGTFSIKSSKYHKTFRDHRFAWEFYNGPIPDGLLVCHKCDNPACCNPEHLFLGTEQDNMTDKINKNRQIIVRGSDVGTSKLTEIDIDEILSGISSGKYQKVSQICNMYNVEDHAIQRILKGERWSHYIFQKYTKSQLQQIRAKIHKDTSSKLDETKVTQIKSMLRQNSSINLIAQQFNVTTQTIYDIRKGKFWSHVV